MVKDNKFTDEDFVMMLQTLSKYNCDLMSKIVDNKRVKNKVKETVVCLISEINHKIYDMQDMITKKHFERDS